MNYMPPHQSPATLLKLQLLSGSFVIMPIILSCESFSMPTYNLACILTCSHLDLLQVSLLINKQTGEEEEKEGKGGRERNLWTTHSENEALIHCSILIGSSANMKESRRSRS